MKVLVRTDDDVGQFKLTLSSAFDLFNAMTEERQVEAIKLVCQWVSDIQSSFKQKTVKRQLASEAFATVTSLAEGLIQEVYGLTDGSSSCVDPSGFFCLTGFDQLHCGSDLPLEEETHLNNFDFGLGEKFNQDFLVPICCDQTGCDPQLNEDQLSLIGLPSTDEGPSQHPINCATDHRKSEGETTAKVEVATSTPNPYKCPECDFSTKHRQNLFRHKQLRHTNGGETPKFTCAQCQRELKTVWSLREHMVYVHGNHERNFKCSQCGKAYLTHKDLLRHRKSHENKRPHKCSFCEKAYNFLTQLKRHVSSAHSVKRAN